jgi:glutathione S-transferase
MPRLFIAPGACSFAAHVILKTLEIGRGFHSEIVKVPLRQPDSPIFAVNPLGRVPTLQLDTGEILTENGAILPYLGDLVPEAGLFAPVGSLERYRIQEWIGFLNSDIHGAFRPISRPEFFNADPATHEGTKAQGLQRLHTLLGHIEKRLPAAGWLFGERFTIADAYLGYFLRGAARTGLPLENFPATTAYAARYESHPAVQAALAAEAA